MEANSDANVVAFGTAILCVITTLIPAIIAVSVMTVVNNHHQCYQ